MIPRIDQILISDFDFKDHISTTLCEIDIFHKQQTFNQNHQTEARSSPPFQALRVDPPSRSPTHREAVTCQVTFQHLQELLVGLSAWGKIDDVKFKKDHIDNIFKTNCHTQQQTFQRKQHYVQTICRLWASKSIYFGRTSPARKDTRA